MTVTINIDLRDKFGPARDQLQRPTCLAFAVSDAHAALRQGWRPLSCEYAFYNAQKRSGRSPLGGALLNDVLSTLREDGQPIEEGWPYLSDLPSDLALYRPPMQAGTCYGRKSEVLPHDFARICSALDHGTPAIVLASLTLSYFNPPPNGIIHLMQGEAVFPNPRHAMIAVGHGVVKGEKVVLIRNSWGPGWGLAGYCWLTESYLAKHMFGLAVLKEDCDVSRRSVAA